MNRAAPIGAEVGLFVDLLARVVEGDIIETKRGRRYGVTKVRVQERGKNVGRQHLRAVVLGDEYEEQFWRYQWIGSVCGIVSPLAPNTIDEYPVGSWEPCVLCDSPVGKACRATVRLRRSSPTVHRIRWYRRGQASGGSKGMARR